MTTKNKIKISVLKALPTMVIICLYLCCGVSLFAQNQSNSDVSILSDEKNLIDDTLILKGNVEIGWDEYKIYADYVEYNSKTKDITAKGRVTMASKQTVITGEGLLFNLKKRTGQMYDTYGQMAPTVKYKTEKIEQVDNETLKFKALDFTTCSQCKPRWTITCKNGTLKKEKYIEMKNVVFKVKKVPVFYIPYLRYPLQKNGRATGFLFPNFGTSSIRGFFLLNSFYWAIKPNMDATIGLDYYTKAGLGLNQEFRYLFKDIEGSVRFYYFKAKPGVVIDKGSAIPQGKFFTYNPSDYYLTLTHNQRLNFLNTRIIASVDRQSDANFLRLFSNDFDAQLYRNSKSAVSISSSHKNMKLSVSASRNDTFYTQTRQGDVELPQESTSIRYLPQVDFNINQQKIWKVPGYFSLNTSFARVQRIGNSREPDNPIYETDITSQRLTINPSYSLKLFSSSWINAKFSISSKTSFYPKSIDPAITDPDENNIVDKPLTLSYQSSKLELKGPSFSKIYQFKNSRLKHIIEPGITIKYVTKVDEEERNRLIEIDYFDFPESSSVTFFLTTRLLDKGNKDKSASEILSYTISQDYYFDPKESNLERKINGKYPAFSELRNTIRLRLFKNFNLDASLNYNHYLKSTLQLPKRFTKILLEMSYRNRKSPINGSLMYSRTLNPYDSESDIYRIYYDRDTIGGSLIIDQKNFPLKFKSYVNYDITDKIFRTASFKMIFDYQCVMINSELKLFKYTDRIETQFNFGVSFGNLGMVKDFLGTR